MTTLSRGRYYVWSHADNKPGSDALLTEEAAREKAARLALAHRCKVDVLHVVAVYEPVSYAREVDDELN